MSKKYIFPIIPAIMFLLIVLNHVSAQDQPFLATQKTNSLPNAGWEEAGIGSATGGGISNNAGDSKWPTISITNRYFHILPFVYISWSDNTSGVNQIYVLGGEGTGWSEVGTGSATGGGISNSPGESLAPDVHSIILQCFGWLDPYVGVIWRDSTSGYMETYSSVGDGWSEVIYDGGLSNQQGNSLSFPSGGYFYNTCMEPIKPFAVWNESDGNDQEIYYSYNNGDIINLSNNNGDSWSPSKSGGYVAWHDYSHDENAAEIYIRPLTGGDSASGGGISNTSGQSSSPSLASYDDNLYVTWEDDTNGNYEIYVRHWDGYQWHELGAGAASGGGISNNSGDSFRPRIALDPDGFPYIAWFDNSSGNYEIYVLRWNGLTWEEASPGSATGGGISDNIGTSGYLDFAIDPNGIPYVVWDDDTNGNQEIYVRRFTGTPTHFCDSVTQIPRLECEALVALFTRTNGYLWDNNDGWLLNDSPCSWYGITCSNGHITKIEMYENSLIGRIPSELGDLNYLQVLYLPNNGLRYWIPHDLGNLTNLQRLNLNGNQLVGSIRKELGNLTNLEYLQLAHNQLGGRIPSELSNLANLEGLFLESNKFSGSIPLTFVSLAELDSLSFFDTYLCEPNNETFQEWALGVNMDSTDKLCPQVEISGNDVVLSWESFSDATSYNIYRSTNPYITLSTPYYVNAYPPFYDDGVAANHVNYFYQITFVDNTNFEFRVGGELGYFVFEIVNSAAP